MPVNRIVLEEALKFHCKKGKTSVTTNNRFFVHQKYITLLLLISLTRSIEHKVPLGDTEKQYVGKLNPRDICLNGKVVLVSSRICEQSIMGRQFQDKSGKTGSFNVSAYGAHAKFSSWKLKQKIFVISALGHLGCVQKLSYFPVTC